MRKFLILVLGLVALASAGSLFLHFNSLCEEETVTEKTSPDGHYVAALMSRNCGATTPFVAHINLRLASSRFRVDFLNGTIKDGEVWGSSSYSGTRFCWSAPHGLEIGYPPEDGRPPLRAWHEVTIGTDYRNPLCQ
jgi:hypothetical protein